MFESKKIIKYISIILIFILLLGFNVKEVKAEPEAKYALWVGGVQVNIDNKDDVLGDGTVKFDPVTATLTSRDANIKGDSIPVVYKGEKYGIYNDVEGLKLILKGENTVKGGSGNNLYYTDAIETRKDMTIAGDGILNVEGGSGTGTYYFESNAISSRPHMETSPITLTIDSGTINAKGNSSAQNYSGISVSRTHVIINGGNINLQGKLGFSAPNPEGSPRRPGDPSTLTINGGSVTAIGQTKAFARNPTIENFHKSEVQVGNNLDGSDADNWNGTDKLGDYGDLTFKYVKIGSEDLIQYNVTFDKNYEGSEAPSVVKVTNGETVPEQPTPIRDAYKFLGWYKTKDGSGEPYDFNTPVTSSFTLYAKWEIDKQDLIDAISAAEVIKVGVSKDGKDIPTDEKWTTLEERIALEKAIGVAETIKDNPNATQEEINDAVSTLNDAIDTYNDGKKDGLQGSETVDNQDLIDAITAAEATKVQTSKDGKDIPTDEKWTTCEERVALEKAICSAEVIRDDKNATQEEINSEIIKLNNAIDKYNNAKKDGLKDVEIVDGEFTIVLDPKGGNLGNNSINTINRKISNLPTPIKPGYTFVGWYDVLGNKWSTGDSVSEDMILYAKWSMEGRPNTPDITVIPGGSGTYTGGYYSCDEAKRPIVDCGNVVKGMFIDVPRTAYFYDSVYWAVEKGITAGSCINTFVPYDITTRAQVVTFLWRAAGKPEPIMKESPFVDVTEDLYFYKPVLWGYENEIIRGITEDEFIPNEIVTRAEAVTFMWRASGKKAGIGKYFIDVEEGAYYKEAVDWAIDEGIVAGTSENTFTPNRGVTRGELVTYLYRQLAK